MLDLRWEWEREVKEKEKEKEREMGVWMKKIKSWSVMIQVFYLVFTDGIIDRRLNINIFNISIDDFVCKVKWKFSNYMKFFRKPLQYYWRLFIQLVIPLRKKVNSRKIINYHRIEKWTILMVSRIYR
jgi:hypothetical protein